MKKIEQDFEIMSEIDGEKILKDIELYARICYKSEDAITDSSAKKFVANLIKWGHESPLEHKSITVKFITDRGCYDKDTMVLTKDGWKYFSDLKLTDQIITLDANNNLLYVEPVNIIAYPYQGKMYAFKSKQVDLLVTPDHRMWVYDYHKRSSDSRVWKFIEAQDCTNKRYKFNKSSNGINREGLKKVTIEGYSVKRGFHTFTYPTKSYDSTTFLKLLGLWLTDGYCSNRKDCGSLEGGIIQIKGKQREVIKNLLNSLGIDYSTTDEGFYFTDQPLLKWLKKTFLKEDDNKKTYYLKLPRTFINSLNKEELQSLLEGIILGDGTKITNSTGYQVYTASYSFAQDLSEIALLVGLTSNIRTQKSRTRTFPNGTTSECKESYVVSLNNKIEHLFDKRTATVETVDYNGMVYCVELPKHHRLFVQRNGKSVWCGNCSHEIVRHRLASYTQESTRYCDYSKGKFKGEITVIPSKSIEENTEAKKAVDKLLAKAEKTYMKLLDMGIKPQDARDVLPTCLKTEIVCTYNLREWRHFFKLRTSKAAHPKIREIATKVLREFQKRIPVVFDDIEVEENV